MINQSPRFYFPEDPESDFKLGLLVWGVEAEKLTQNLFLGWWDTYPIPISSINQNKTITKEHFNNPDTIKLSQ